VRRRRDWKGDYATVRGKKIEKRMLWMRVWGWRAKKRKGVYWEGKQVNKNRTSYRQGNGQEKLLEG